jgi:hypothetical protein
MNFFPGAFQQFTIGSNILILWAVQLFLNQGTQAIRVGLLPEIVQQDGNLFRSAVVFQIAFKKL